MNNLKTMNGSEDEHVQRMFASFLERRMKLKSEVERGLGSEGLAGALPPISTYKLFITNNVEVLQRRSAQSLWASAFTKHLITYESSWHKLI